MNLRNIRSVSQYARGKPPLKTPCVGLSVLRGQEEGRQAGCKLQSHPLATLGIFTWFFLSDVYQTQTKLRQKARRQYCLRKAMCAFVYYAGGCKATPGINRKAPFHPMWCHTEGCRRDQELWFFLQSAQSDSLPISSSKAVIVKLSLVMYVSSRLSICNCQSDTHIFILSGIE